VLQGVILAAAAMAAASVQMTAQPFPAVLPVAASGLRCPSGGRAIGDPVGKSYILQELEIDSREKQPKLVGFVYSGADGNDYIDLSPSVGGEKTRLMRDGEIDRATMVMRYCFSAPWDGARAASH
jgi:hypothetical protein